MLRDRRNTVIARAGEDLSLELLGRYEATDADLLDETPDPMQAARWFRATARREEVVRASAYNTVRQRSDPVQARVRR